MRDKSIWEEFWNSENFIYFSLHVTTSIYPVPSICSQDQISDWFASLAECLHWNVRKKQKHFDELSDLTRSSSDDTMDSLEKPAAGSSAAVAELSDAKSAATQKSWKQNKSQFQFFFKKKKKVAFLNARKKLYKTMIEEDFLVGQNLMNFLMTFDFHDMFMTMITPFPAPLEWLSKAFFIANMNEISTPPHYLLQLLPLWSLKEFSPEYAVIFF